ncbi:hypothetical protein [Flavobacterium sp.]|uniref:hypothetical protein n=1 Tax=Flavobacterium sp. TaxID=239 RepID=UPI00261718C4|nr:hypothetical protein [Flavobacterium sp.]
MDRLKKIIIALTILVGANNWAQKNAVTTSTSESIYMHTNANSFVSGETLLYKLYCLNPDKFSKSEISKIAYVELIGLENQVLFKHKLFLESGIGQGDFFIPSSIKTGTYKLLGYTRWMQNKSESKSFETDITIINPFQSDIENKISSKNVLSNQTSETSSTDISIDLKNKKIGTRSMVNLNIITNVEDLKKGSYSLSVRKIQDLPAQKKINPIEFKNSDTNKSQSLSSSNFFLPELRGEIISGQVISKNNLLSINNLSIAVSIPGKYFTTKLTKTNADGKFFFSLDKTYFYSELIVQIVSNFKEELVLKLDESFASDKTNLKLANDYSLTPEIKPAIEEHSVASQIENTYYTKKADSLAKINYPTPFYEPLTNEYILDNYNRFPTVRETIIEVVKEVNYDKNNGIYSLRLNDYDPNTDVTEPPLVLIDGLVVQDINELLEYKAADIYKICTINSGYLFGNKLFSGLISFITKKQDYQTKLSGDFIVKRKIETPVLNKNYFKPNYRDPTLLSRIPDYRYQLLWLSNLDLNNSNLSFYTSDVKGKFEIVIEGFSDKGEAIYVKNYIEVE